MKSLRKIINKLFKATKSSFERPGTASPTYNPELAETIKTITVLIDQHIPNKDLSPLKALGKAYGRKNPSTAQLKTACFGNNIATDLLARLPEELKELFLRDDLNKISEMTATAANHLETEYGRPRYTSIEHAKILAGDFPEINQGGSSYLEKLSTLITELKKNPRLYPANATDKLQYAIWAIKDFAEGNAPDFNGLEALDRLEGRLHAVNEIAKNLIANGSAEGAERLEKAASELLEYSNDPQNGPMALLDTVENLLAHSDKFGKTFRYKKDMESDVEKGHLTL